MIVPDIIWPDILYSREINHSMITGKFYVEAQSTTFDGKLILLSYYSGLSQRIGFTLQQSLQLISAIKEANTYCQERSSSSDRSWKTLSIKQKLRTIPQLIAYYFYPDVLFSREVPSSFENGRVFIQVESNFFENIHLVFVLKTGISAIPKIHFPPAAVSKFVEALEEAYQTASNKNG
ncbi:hypothetical protein [Microvirga rosea]|uniref:hypothetical protein n=1 Tax=Microvirga rosea TaxID=2715425 RepID=UPI001D0BD744|nr:hypothetical protein [Microvirga rosea]MCB8819957.1 hypothetical protein [Microvirga rosea]